MVAGCEAKLSSLPDVEYQKPFYDQHRGGIIVLHLRNFWADRVHHFIAVDGNQIWTAQFKKWQLKQVRT